MLYVLFAVLSSVLASVYGICLNVDGQSVSWWILFQQKERPYFHNYIDSTNSQRIKDHYPERNDSVLSRAVASVTHNNDAEYVIYSSDLINVKDIAAKFSIPTYSKWMHGILGTVSSWESGFWILHNNLLFPALTNDALAVPGSKAWYATTVGDSSADLFYICLTAENKGNITEMLISIMAGNPFIYKKKLENHDFLQPYFKEVRPLQTSFGYEMSASMFLNCMYTSRRNVSTNCLFTYAVTTGVGINVFTRPRGMIKHSTTFCYDDQSLSVFDFLKLEGTTTLKSGFTHSMFALSDSTGTTCFGQDVAANAETVAVMICATLPKVHTNIIKSSRQTKWSCRRENKNLKYNTEISNFRVMQQTPFSKPSMEKIKGGKTSNTVIAHTANDFDEKNETKFCQMYECKVNEGTQKKEEMVDINALKSPFMKNQKTADWFNAIANDIRMQHIIENPRKKQKINKQTNYNAITIKGPLEVSRFLLKNVKAVLGLFCREGCGFCQNAKEQFIWLAKCMQTDGLDFVIVDILEPSLPDYLQVPFTPYVRYKFSGLSEWIAYTGNKYDVENVVIFLHYITTVKRFTFDALSDVSGDKGTNLNDVSHLEISKRKIRDTIEFAADQSNEVGLIKETASRIKREVDDQFTYKHILEYAGKLSTITEDEVEKEFIRVNGTYPRNENTFLTTRDAEVTTTKMINITNTYFWNNKTKDDSIYEKINGVVIRKVHLIRFDRIDINDIGAILVYFRNKPRKCGYYLKGSVIVGAKVNSQNSGFWVRHFEKMIRFGNLTPCNKNKVKKKNKGVCNNKNKK